MKQYFKLIALLLTATALLWACQPSQEPEDDKPGQEQPDNPDNPDNPEDPTEQPTIVLESEQVTASFFGETIAIPYTINNPVEGGTIAVNIPDSNDWIDVEVTQDNILLNIAENISNGEEARNDILVAVYTYGEESVKAYFNVIQEGVAYDQKHEISYIEFLWYYPKGELANYYITMSDANGIKIDFDLFSEVWTEDQLPAEGVYLPAECGEEGSFTFCNFCTYYLDRANGIEAGFPEGQIIIRREQEEIILNAYLIDDYGTSHLIVYKTDEGNIVDGTIESNLASDWNATVDGAALGGMTLYYYGPGYTDNSNAWGFEIRNYENLKPKDYEFYGEMYTITDIDLNTAQEGGLDGLVLTMDSEAVGAPNTYSEGMSGYGGSWLFQVYEITGNQIVYGAQTPLKDGTITFTQNEDGTYDIQLNVLDDNYDTPHNVNVLFDNTPINFVDYTAAEGYSMKQQSVTGKRSR